jgi:2-polyprenyl-3-methyl-5-hydroxy-6-metoxy-1,4-benzoquinol methylase
MNQKLFKLASYLNKAGLKNEALFVYNIIKKSSYTDIDDIPQSLLKSYTESHKNIKEQVEGPMKEESNFHEFSEDDLGRAHMSAMSRRSASAPTKYLLDRKLIIGRVLDYGCGKGEDAKTLENLEFDVEKYDPHYYPEIPTGKFDTIICNYVLNVVDEENRSLVLNNIKSLLNDEGIAYISVRNDLKDDVVKAKGYNQYRVYLPEDEFELIKKTGSFKMYKYQK